MSEKLDQDQVKNSAAQEESAADPSSTQHEEVQNQPKQAEKQTENQPNEGEESTQAEKAEEDQETPSVEELLEKLSAAEQKAEENYQKLLRAQADFDNFRRRTRQEREEQAKYAALPLMEDLLPVLDNFERALIAGKEATDTASIVQGVEMVFRQVEQVLQDAGLSVIPSVGEPFDPNVHQAVAQEESSEYDSGVVTEELQKGYKLKERVIRPAMVKVSS